MNEKKNIQDLVDLLTERHGLGRQQADSFVKEFFGLIEEALESDKYVKIKGLGTFKLINVESRESINVNTGERFEIQEHTKISFTPDPALKETINKPFAHFETVPLNEGVVLEDTPVAEEEETPAVAVEEITATVAAREEELEAPATAPVEEVAPDVEEAVPTVEEVAPDVEATPAATVPADEEEYRDRDPRTMRYFIGIVVMVVGVCAAALAFLYYPELYDIVLPRADKRYEPSVATLPADTLRQAVERDTVAVMACPDTPAVERREKPEAAPKASQAPQAEEQTTVASQPKRAEQTVAWIPDTLSYRIVGTVGTYTIRQGETLTRVALRYWGSKKMWPYLVIHNPKAIKNPDNVPYGTTLRIPQLQKK